MKTQRISMVDNILIRNILSGSTLQIGDSQLVEPRVSALAVQKEFPVFSGTEGDLTRFPIFSKPLERMTLSEDVALNVINEVPIIKTGNIKITSIAAAAVVHIGNTNRIDIESRIKHFRRFFTPPPGYFAAEGPSILS